MNAEFRLVDLDAYPRREHFEFFSDRVPCTYSATVDIDVTRLRAALKVRGLRAYPAQIYLLTAAANRLPEFRMSFDDAGRLGTWSFVSPMYTVLNPERNTFSGVWTEFRDDFPAFYEACIVDMARFGTGEYMPQRDVPANTIDISSIPWVDFTAFNLNLPPGKHLLPIFTLGKYREIANKTLLPLAIQAHHAVCDGFHLGQFVEHVRDLAERCDDWLGPAANSLPAGD